MMKNRESLTGGRQCLKYILFAFNLVFFVLGCAVLAIGLLILFKKNFMSKVFGNEMMTASVYCIIVAAAAVIVVSFFGCCGAIRKNKCLLLAYFVTVIPITLFLLVGAILAVVYRNQIENSVQHYMRTTIKRDYGVDLDLGYHQSITDAWDQAQENLLCCSVVANSWMLYRDSLWYKSQPANEKPLVPLSCCRRDQFGVYLNRVKCQTWSEGPPGLPAGLINEAIHYKGCYEAGKDFIYRMSDYLMAMGLVLAALLVAGMMISIFLYRNV